MSVLLRSLGIVGMAWLGGCASLAPGFRASPDVSRPARDPAGLELSQEDYRVTLERWPWIRDGRQLRRRTLILALRPSFAQLEALDRSRDPRLEVEILSRLSPSL